ncbi:hypothetical protein HDU67_002926 [Dinochytrium kinnereticum]|nr:hypothetical protein HDU67_002926 [Dinochytrium kinnereticum]
MVKEACEVEDAMNTANSNSLYICTPDLESRRKALVEFVIGEEVDSPALDIIAGFCFFDEDVKIYVFECPNGPGFQLLQDVVARQLAQNKMSTPGQSLHWTFWPCHKRVWKPISAGMVYVKLKESLLVSGKIPKNYIFTKIGANSFECMTFLMNLSTSRNHVPLHLYCKVPTITAIFEFVQAFGEITDFLDSVVPFEQETKDEGIIKECLLIGKEKKSTGSISSRVDHKNAAFAKWITAREGIHMDFIAAYTAKYPLSSTPRIRERFGKPVYNYSIQKLSTTSIQLEALRSRMKQNTSYFYSKPFDLSLAPIQLQD